MEKVKVEVIREEGVQLPIYGTEFSAGADVRANVKETTILKVGETKLIPTGLKLGIPDGYEIQLRPRSGLALKKQITMLNTPATIDADYTGEIGIILTNLGKEDFVIERGDRLCQMVLNKVEQIEFVKVSELKETKRNSGGFGHTGVK